MLIQKVHDLVGTVHCTKNVYSSSHPYYLGVMPFLDLEDTCGVTGDTLTGMDSCRLLGLTGEWHPLLWMWLGHWHWLLKKNLSDQDGYPCHYLQLLLQLKCPSVSACSSSCSSCSRYHRNPESCINVVPSNAGESYLNSISLSWDPDAKMVVQFPGQVLFQSSRICVLSLQFPPVVWKFLDSWVEKVEEKGYLELHLLLNYSISAGDGMLSEIGKIWCSVVS